MIIRINSIGIKSPSYFEKLLSKNDNGEHMVVIVKYHPNRYYGQLQHYLKNGWKDKGIFIQDESETTILDKKVFENKESFYEVATLDYNKNTKHTELKSVADRLLYLTEEEKKDFFEVYQIADRKLIQKVDEFETCKTTVDNSTDIVEKVKTNTDKFLKQIDKQRQESRYVTRTKSGSPLFYAKFDENYKPSPTNTKQYVNQYKAK